MAAAAAIFGWPSSAGKERKTFCSPAGAWQPIGPAKWKHEKKKRTMKSRKVVREGGRARETRLVGLVFEQLFDE